MSFLQYRTLLLILSIILALFAALPALQRVLVLPQTDYLTELSVFGPYHNATYPYGLATKENYRLYLDITNRLKLLRLLQRRGQIPKSKTIAAG